MIKRAKFREDPNEFAWCFYAPMLPDFWQWTCPKRGSGRYDYLKKDKPNAVRSRNNWIRMLNLELHASMLDAERDVILALMLRGQPKTKGERYELVREGITRY